jgi:RNA recognition motif-containing protein
MTHSVIPPLIFLLSQVKNNLRHFSCNGIGSLWARLVLRDFFEGGSPVTKKLYVGNLTYETTDSDLQNLFGPFGTVQSAQVIMDRDTGRSKGFGFVEMNSGEEAQAAINGLHEHEINGRRLNVNEAKPREERGGGGGNRGGGGGGRRY